MKKIVNEYSYKIIPAIHQDYCNTTQYYFDYELMYSGRIGRMRSLTATS